MAMASRLTPGNTDGCGVAMISSLADLVRIMYQEMLLPTPNRQTEKIMKNKIATTPEQSQRLIACGVDTNTCDLAWQVPITLSQKKKGDKVLIFRNTDRELYSNDTPAWSLSALLALCPNDLMWQGLYYRFVMGPTENGWEIEYNDLSVLHNRHRVIAKTAIEAVVQMIEWLVKNGYTLNKS